MFFKGFIKTVLVNFVVDAVVSYYCIYYENYFILLEQTLAVSLENKKIFFFIGILGFWSGMMPRALGEALTVALGAGIAYGLNMYADKNLKSYTSHISSFLAASLCYPFTVVSHCSIGELKIQQT